MANEQTIKRKTDIMELFSDAKYRKSYLRISAPMVRYSKLEFRTLLRQYKTDLCFTPMIIADSFCRSNLARHNEFTTNEDDTPLIAQFAAKDSIEFLTAAELIYPYVDGVDLNCGCPQRWAISSGYGCATLKQPDVLQDMIRTLRRNLPGSFTVSVKMRLLQRDEKRTTIELCRVIEQCGASFITIHGRTPWEKASEPPDMEIVGNVKQSLNIPVVANGDIRSLNDADRAHEQTQCDGIMAARGLLTNPSLFTGTPVTPITCIEKWISLAERASDHITFQCFHHHITFMTEKLMARKRRTAFNNITKKEQVIDFLKDEFQIGTLDLETCLSDYTQCIYDDKLYERRKENAATTTASLDA